jgi:hypothetical protein
VVSTLQGLYLHTGQQKYRKSAHTDMHALSGIRNHKEEIIMLHLQYGYERTVDLVVATRTVSRWGGQAICRPRPSEPRPLYTTAI